MARKNRLTIIFYFLFGAVVGAFAGFLANTFFLEQSSTQMEARVMLFRLPSNDTYQAARDFVSFSIRRPGFIENFALEQGIDDNTRELISKNLRVEAEDAASTIAELVLGGMDEEKLVATLDALTMHLIESLRSVDESTMQSVSHEIEQEIANANEAYLGLQNDRRKFGPTPERLREHVEASAGFAAEKKELELSLKYFLKPVSELATQSIRQKLAKTVKASDQHDARIEQIVGADYENYRFAKSLAITEANLRALRRTKQSLVIEFNKASPLRVASGAKLVPRVNDLIPVNRAIGVGAFIGALLGGFVWSLRRSSTSGLTGLEIEESMGIPTVAVIGQTLIGKGKEKRRPLKLENPGSDELAGIKSLSVAAHILNTEKGSPITLVLTELGNGEYIAHVAANLALEMANLQARVLVVETATTEKTYVSDLFERGVVEGWVSTLKAQDESRADRGSVTYLREKEIALAPEVMARFDCVLIVASTAIDAKKRLAKQKKALGFVLCKSATRASTLRKAVGGIAGTRMHGVILCDMKA